MLGKTGICVAIILIFAFSQSVYKNNGQVRLAPRMLNYQGYLTDTQGNPITNPSVSMTFAIFDAVSAGNQKWTETQSTVSVDKGIFNVLLGSVSPIPDSVFTNSTNRWLELSVAGQTLSPRTQIVSSVYSYTSTYSDTAQYSRNAAPDNDWIFLISDGADTTLQMGGRWGLTRSGNVLYGSADSTHVNFGVACTTGRAGQPSRYCTVAGGSYNTASSSNATVSGGFRNNASGLCATVGGGWADTAKALYGGALSGYSNLAGDNAVDTAAAVCAGYNNSALARFAFVGGGWDNTASEYATTVSGGYLNTANNYYTAVGGGVNNIASGQCATVGGGINNAASGYYAAMGGGNGNVASGYASVVAGGSLDSAVANYGGVFSGYNNLAGDAAEDSFATVCGGLYNAATARVSYIGGGRNNTARGYASTIGGGDDNDVGWSYATVGGGSFNSADSAYSTVGGGSNNHTYDNYATVGGGQQNIASSNHAIISGGLLNRATNTYATVGGGRADTASGINATVPGGIANKAAGNYSFAAGRRAKANNQGCFVWGDATDADVAANVDNRWVARCSGGVYFYTNSSLSSGVYVAAGGNSWSAVSDRNMKENFEPVDGAVVLNKLSQMPITTWNYKSQDPSIRHIGPMAQDFAGFGVGEDDKHITTIDADGIALAAIQELAKQVQELKAENKKLQERIETLENR
ncbi:MAG TPA: tail fiber domain-containing protein [bacterium]